MKNMNYEIIDNFLPEPEYQKIKGYLEEFNCNWNYNDFQVGDVEDDNQTPYFSHIFYHRDRCVYNEQGMRTIEPLLKMIGSNIIFCIKANLVLSRKERSVCKPHKDMYTNSLTHKTSVFILTDCNAKTILYGDKNVEVESVGNRLLTFDAETLHSCEFQTDTKRRIVININHMRL